MLLHPVPLSSCIANHQMRQSSGLVFLNEHTSCVSRKTTRCTAYDQQVREDLHQICIKVEIALLDLAKQCVGQGLIPVRRTSCSFSSSLAES